MRMRQRAAPDRYRSASCTPGGDQYYHCTACGARPLVSDSERLQAGGRQAAVDVFSQFANRSPVRGARLKSTTAYYRILEFNRRRCQAHSGAVDGGVMDGRRRLPEAMHIEADAQVYTLNWISRMDRRNVDISSYCSGGAGSWFV